MIQYILESIAFQLVFLVTYDLFLKRETFFQWNRLYLIGTYVASLVLPWVKIEALKTTMPEQFYVSPEFLWPVRRANDLATNIGAAQAGHEPIDWSWQKGVLYIGMLLATFFFVFKLYRIHRLRQKGSVRYFSNFTRVVVENSELAFSFFRFIFLGDQVVKREHEKIIRHELVHIEQGHSYDLLFFELMRIGCWFNPLVYIYQNRASELHEFIADAHVAKTDKKQQYQLLLSEVFHTQNISFINQFFKSSLVKKRIVMLQKSKSKGIWKLKYLALLPILMGIVFYTSSEAQELTDQAMVDESQSDDVALIEKVKTKIKEEVAELGSLKEVHLNHPDRSHFAESEGSLLSKEAYFESAILFKMMMREMSEEIPKKLGSQFKDFSSRIPQPSTTRYQSYVIRKEAFQILDENLKFSISYNIREVPIGVLKMDAKAKYPDTFDVFEVVDVTDLTGDEIRIFNHKIDAIFKEGNLKYTDLILKDKHYSFQIFEAAPLPGLNYFPKASSNANDTPKEEKARPSTSIFTVDEVPVFPGCEDAEDKRACFIENVERHISKNFNYPKEALENGVQGDVYVLFAIDEEGTIGDIRKRGPNALLEDEAERIISKLPKMEPAKNEGKVVKVRYSIPITFKL